MTRLKPTVQIAALLIVPFLVTGCGLRREPTAGKVQSKTSPVATANTATKTDSSVGATVNESVNYLGIDPASLDSVIKANYQLAEAKVKDWKKDAVLYHFSVKIPSDLTPGKATEVYTFGSPTDAYNWWTMNISGKTGKSVRAIIPKEDYLGTTLNPVPLRFWKSNYIEALQLAEINGGSDFRATHAEAEISVSLAVGQPRNYLWWTVEYHPISGESFKRLVHPETKEVFDATGQPLQPAASSPSPTVQTAPATSASPNNSNLIIEENPETITE